MTRRSLLLAGSAGLSVTAMSKALNTGGPRYKLGIATTSYMGVWRPHDTMEFLEHCRKLGAAGIQASINGDPATLRSRAEEYGMFIEAMVELPHETDAATFEASVKKAQAAGAVALRAATLGTRRYETFSSLDDWRQFERRREASLRSTLPVLEHYRIPLGLENHKDWTADEMAAALKGFSSEYLGVCLDFGNNISLLDDPMYAIEKLAPFAVSTHFKNMAVDHDPDGFLLSEVLLGDGYLDLPRAVQLVRQARPNTRFSLEMITRDPLKVPCLTDTYWATFPDRNGIYLARTLRFVEEHPSSKPLPRVSSRPHAEQLRIEEQNVVDCLRYAHDSLDL